MKKKIIALLTFAVLACLVFAGCKKESSGGDADVEAWDENVTVSWWLVGGTDQYYQYYWKEMKSLQKIQELTNITIEFQVAINYDAYLPMMTAKTYPDIITAKNLERYTGRMAGMHDDGVSIELNGYMDEYMPNFKALLEEYPDLGRDIRLDGGVYTYLSTFYDINDDTQRALTSEYGLVIRQDWLDAVGEKVPENMEDWYRVLKAFKQQDPNGNGDSDEEPFIACSSGWKYFLPAYGIDDDPSLQGNTVVFGYMTDAYKEYLTEMNKWYTENLLFYMFDKTSLENQRDRVTGNFAGSWKGGVTNFDEDDTTSFLAVLREKAPSVAFSPCPWPKTADGKQWCFSDISSFHRDTTVITSNAVEHGVAEAAAYLLDFMLSEDGTTLLTWGIEGESYEVVGGEKQLMSGMDELVDFHGTKIQTFNTYADNLTVAFPSRGDIVADYVFSQKSEDYINASYVFAEGDTSYKMLAPVQLSTSLEAEADEIQGEMKDYMTKMRQRFVTGRMPLTNYDSYLEQCRLLGGDTFTQIWQQAYDAYLER